MNILPTECPFRLLWHFPPQKIILRLFPALLNTPTLHPVFFERGIFIPSLSVPIESESGFHKATVDGQSVSQKMWTTLVSNLVENTTPVLSLDDTDAIFGCKVYVYKTHYLTNLQPKVTWTLAITYQHTHTQKILMKLQQASWNIAVISRTSMSYPYFSVMFAGVGTSSIDGIEGGVYRLNTLPCREPVLGVWEKAMKGLSLIVGVLLERKSLKESPESNSRWVEGIPRSEDFWISQQRASWLYPSQCLRWIQTMRSVVAIAPTYLLCLQSGRVKDEGEQALMWCKTSCSVHLLLIEAGVTGQSSMRLTVAVSLQIGQG